jgi:hypothetical protein
MVANQATQVVNLVRMGLLVLGGYDVNVVLLLADSASSPAPVGLAA